MIATNYAERIDAAAKRRGRIDVNALLAPPDCEARKRIVLRLIEKHLKGRWKDSEIELRWESFQSTLDSRLTPVLDATRLKVFGELKQIFDDARDRTIPQDQAEEELNSLIEALEEEAKKAPRAAITLRSYGPRFKVGNKPYDEFLVVLYICLSNNGDLEKEVRDLVEQVMTQLAQRENDWEGMQAEEKRRAVRDPAKDVLRQDSVLVDKLLQGFYG